MENVSSYQVEVDGLVQSSLFVRQLGHGILDAWNQDLPVDIHQTVHQVHQIPHGFVTENPRVYNKNHKTKVGKQRTQGRSSIHYDSVT